ncbi:MAG: restriction endonuclease [Candidatus Bathyarchaeia archaeon]
MKDKVTLIKEDGDIIGFRINDREFYSDENGLVEVQIDDLKGFTISSIPNGFWLYPLEGNTIAFEGRISSGKKYAGIASMNIHIYRKYWDHKFGALQYVNAMKRAIDIRRKSNNDVKFIEIEDDGAHIFFRYDIFLSEDMPIDMAFQRFREIVHEIEGHTERLLEGEELSSEILNDETKFALEVLLPLFRNMGFVDVKYNHGKREFGKDITFSEIDRFGVRRNYGVQVKAGDLSGEAGAEIDKIIAQIEDAFSMPYVDITSREKRYISDIIIAISGRFTENAKDKIIEKTNWRNLYFLDIDKIQELLAQYMKKMVKTSK